MPIEVVEKLKAELLDQPHNPLRHNQIRAYEAERSRLQTMRDAPPWVSGGARADAAKSLRRVEKTLADQAPKRIDEPDRRDRVAKLTEEVIKDVVQPAMLTHAEMRRNPAGAVDAFMRRENHPVVKDAILAVKRAMRGLNPDHDGIDYTNMERFRRSGINPDGVATYMADAQLPGNFAFGPLAKENWPFGDPQVDTALKQVQRRELTGEAREAAQARAAKARQALADKRAALKATAGIEALAGQDTFEVAEPDAGGEG